MSYWYKDKDIRPNYFKMMSKWNARYGGKDVPTVRIIAWEQPSAVGESVKATVMLECVDAELQGRRVTTENILTVINAVIDGRLGITNPTALDHWTGWWTSHTKGRVCTNWP